MNRQHPPKAFDEETTDGFLDRLDQRLAARNGRMWRRLVAWGELLDAAGWCVALQGGGSLWLGELARQDLESRGGVPERWPDLIGMLGNSREKLSGEGVALWSSGKTSPDLDLSLLTPREREVLEWLRQGKAGPEIAVILGCAQRTVEKHVANLYRKLGIKNRSSAILGGD